MEGWWKGIGNRARRETGSAGRLEQDTAGRLGPRRPASPAASFAYLPRVDCQRLVLVGDAHLGRRAASSDDSLLAFLDAVPTLGDGLVVTGDLFEFWFAYHRAIPRANIRIVAALAGLRRRVPIVMVGGNHDRWAGDFWRELEIEFQPRAARFTLGGRPALALHGDGITESDWSARTLHRLTSNAGTIALFRAIHPDLGFWLVDRLSKVLGDRTRDPEALAAAANRQRIWALEQLAEDPSLGLVAMGHTHHAAVAEVATGRLYVNPGPWFDGQRYAVVGDGRATLASFGG